MENFPNQPSHSNSKDLARLKNGIRKLEAEIKMFTKFVSETENKIEELEQRKIKARTIYNVLEEERQDLYNRTLGGRTLQAHLDNDKKLEQKYKESRKTMLECLAVIPDCEIAIESLEIELENRKNDLKSLQIQLEIKQEIVAKIENGEELSE
jgi:chromosome segregation ATPase